MSPTGRLRKTRAVQIFFSLSFFNVQFRASCYPNLLFCASAFTRCPPEIQFRQRALASLLAPESSPPACLHVGGAYQRFLFFFPFPLIKHRTMSLSLSFTFSISILLCHLSSYPTESGDTVFLFLIHFPFFSLLLI